MDSEKWEEERSRRLSRTMDCLGYSKKVIQSRKEFYRKGSSICFGATNNFGSVVGSKAEGLTRMGESDIDFILFVPNFLCGEDYLSCDAQLPQDSAYLRIKLLRPGYYRLEPNISAIIDYSDLFYHDNDRYCLSTRVLKLIIDLTAYSNPFNHYLSGPAGSFSFSTTDADFVLSILCMCPSILEKWMTRPRRIDWPPLVIRQKISKMSGNVVPLGYDEASHLTWRMCFNTVEIAISDCLNSTQVKLYIILKMIKNDVLRPKNFNVTSYIIKNVVFWLAENFPQSRFRPETLFSWVVKALKVLKRAVIRNYLPYYMIPGRNLITEKIPQESRIYLIQEIQSLIERGPLLILECVPIRSVAFFRPYELKVSQNQYKGTIKRYRNFLRVFARFVEIIITCRQNVHHFQNSF